MEKIAFFGGSFDPPHKGHLAIAHALKQLFALDKFVFVPAHHAPHKKDRIPTSPFHRFTMLAMATAAEAGIEVSAIEVETPEKPYTFETLTRLKERFPVASLYFVIGADSWQDITSWREWETVLTMVNIIVVTRPEYPVSMDHVSDSVRERIMDLRVDGNAVPPNVTHPSGLGIFITDAVNLGISATGIRGSIASGDASWRRSVPEEVADYIDKYGIYR